MKRRRATETTARPFELPGMTPAEACNYLIEHSALTWAELMVLELAATGEETCLEITVQQAKMKLARWRGPIPGVKLLPLPHWGTAVVRGGLPLDPDRRRATRNPFLGDLSRAAGRRH